MNNRGLHGLPRPALARGSRSPQGRAGYPQRAYCGCGAGAGWNILVRAAGRATRISLRGGAGRSGGICGPGAGFTLVDHKPALTYI